MRSCLLLARGRDRLETLVKMFVNTLQESFSYSLGDAIDWKHTNKRYSNYYSVLSYSLGDAIDWKLNLRLSPVGVGSVSYSLGDAIDWKQQFRRLGVSRLLLSYSLGDAIDWKLLIAMSLSPVLFDVLLLARGRDRLETG